MDPTVYLEVHLLHRRFAQFAEQLRKRGLAYNQPMATARRTTEGAHVIHPVPALYDEVSRVLILGTMASPVSRKMGFYYGHPQNRFWKVLSALFDEDVGYDVVERRALALRYGIALFDVLAACDIEGAADASIQNPVPSDLAPILATAPIQAVFTTGGKASALYKKFHAPLYPDLPHIALPSTSPANARMTLAELIEAYSVIGEYLSE